MAELTDAKRRIIERLKRVEQATAPDLAADFGLTDTAIRQHLDSLEITGLVERTTAPTPTRGRPPVWWRLAPLAAELFPDRHADLTVELITSIREALGDQALDRVIATRTTHQLAAYRQALPDPTTSSVAVRVRRLAEIRTAEGYLAEAVESADDILLIEHHCPICNAAATCQGLCSTELELFRAALGPDAVVEREQHLLSGDTRCAYRISTAQTRPDAR
jgi:predicted ArsR family transcriptional regulator